MKWLGFICLIILICYSGYPSKVDKLEKQAEKLKNELKKLKKSLEIDNRNGELEMSKFIAELSGKKCIISLSEYSMGDFLPFGEKELSCTIIDTDEEWVKVTYTEKVKKDEEKSVTRLIRISDIESIEICE